MFVHSSLEFRESRSSERRESSLSFESLAAADEREFFSGRRIWRPRSRNPRELLPGIIPAYSCIFLQTRSAHCSLLHVLVVRFSQWWFWRLSCPNDANLHFEFSSYCRSPCTNFIQNFTCRSSRRRVLVPRSHRKPLNYLFGKKNAVQLDSRRSLLARASSKIRRKFEFRRRFEENSKKTRENKNNI